MFWSKGILIVLSVRLWARDFYLNNRVLLSRNYLLIITSRKCDVFKTNICPRSETSRANMLVLRTYCPLYCSPLNILPRASSKTSWIISKFFRWNPCKLNVNFEKKNRRVLAIRVYSADENYGLLVESFSMTFYGGRQSAKSNTHTHPWICVLYF